MHLKHVTNILDPFSYRPLCHVAYYNPSTKQLASTDTFRLHVQSIDLWESPIYFDHTGSPVTSVRMYKTKRGEGASRKTPHFIDEPLPQFPDIVPFMSRANYHSQLVTFDIPAIKKLLKHPLIQQNYHSALHSDGSITIHLNDWLIERHDNIFTSIIDHNNFPTYIGINLQYLLEWIEHLYSTSILMEWKMSLTPVHFSDDTRHSLIMPLKI